MSRDTRKLVFGSDINQPVQLKTRASSLKFRIEEEELYYPRSENKGADQLRSYCEADLRLCFRIGKNLSGFQSHDAHIFWLFDLLLRFHGRKQGPCQNRTVV